CGIRQPKEEQNPAISTGLQPVQQLQITSTAQSCLECERRSLFDQFVDAFEEYSPSPDFLRFWRKWRKARSNQISIQELTALHKTGQELGRERSLSGAVGPGDEVYAW